MSKIPEEFWTDPQPQPQPDPEPDSAHRCLTCDYLPCHWNRLPCVDCDGYTAWVQRTDIKILKFINGFKPAVELFTHGYCYWFAVILQERFSGVIMYNEVDNHFALLVDNRLYDATGGIPAVGFTAWSVYQTAEPLNAWRVRRDCVYK